MPKINKNIKTIEIDGKKFYEREGVKLVSILDYGVEKIKGSQIQGQANIKLGFNIDSNADYTMLSGYLNNKVIPGTNEPAKDSYGDIPTGDNVYDFSRLKNNPVALIDHDNTAAGIAGNFIFLEENDQGLKFREILRPLEEIYTNGVKDVISSWANGWGRAYSIGGRWLYDMEKSNPDNNHWILVKAILTETSHVAVGADQWALSNRPDVSFVEIEGKIAESDTLEKNIKGYIDTKDDSYLKKILEKKE